MGESPPLLPRPQCFPAIEGAFDRVGARNAFMVVRSFKAEKSRTAPPLDAAMAIASASETPILINS